MKQPFVPLLLLAAALAVWWLWPQPSDRGQPAGRAVAMLATPEPASVPSDEPRSRVEVGIGTIEGVVTGPDGAVAGAHVRLHRAEEKVAFHECVTRADGRYRLQVRVDADGESLDLRIVPKERSGLNGRVARYLVVKANVTLELDFKLRRSRNLKIVAIDAPTDGPFDFALLPEKAWSELVAGSIEGQPQKFAIRKAASDTIRRQGPFRFKGVDEEFQVVVCVTEGYFTPDPPRVRGGDEITVVVKRLVGFIVQVFDASTGEALPYAKALRRMGGEPDVAASGPGTGFRLAHVLDTHEPATVRIESVGYFPLVWEIPRGALRPRPRSFYLVPRSSLTLTVRVKGPGAARFLDGFWISATQTENRRWTHLPMGRRTSSTLHFAIPAATWAIHIRHPRIPFAQSGGITIQANQDRDLTLEVPDFATLEVQFPRAAVIASTDLHSAKIHWEEFKPGQLAVRAQNNGGWSARLNMDGKRKQTFLLLPGRSEVHWEKVGRPGTFATKRRKLLDLEPGAHAKLVLD